MLSPTRPMWSPGVACGRRSHKDPKDPKILTRPRMRTSLVRQQSLRVGGMDDRVHREVYKMNANVYAARVNTGCPREGMSHGGISYVATQGRNCRATQQTRTMRST